MLVQDHTDANTKAMDLAKQINLTMRRASPARSSRPNTTAREAQRRAVRFRIRQAHGDGPQGRHRRLHQAVEDEGRRPDRRIRVRRPCRSCRSICRRPKRSRRARRSKAPIAGRAIRTRSGSLSDNYPQEPAPRSSRIGQSGRASPWQSATRRRSAPAMACISTMRASRSSRCPMAMRRTSRLGRLAVAPQRQQRPDLLDREAEPARRPMKRNSWISRSP